MADSKEYKDCVLIIREPATGNVIAKTIITDYAHETMTISIHEGTFSLHGIPRVLLNIFYGESIYEYMGTVRKLIPPSLRQISLYKRSILPDPRTKRYQVETSATIEEILLDGEGGGKIDVPMKVILLNISSGGALLKTNCQNLVLDTCFKLRLMIGDTDTCINTTIVRVTKNTEEDLQFGCLFNYIYE